MNMANVVVPDDLVLARLTAAKLGKVIHGINVRGHGSTASGITGPITWPEWYECLWGSVMCWAASAKPGQADKIPLVRQPVDELSKLAKEFETSFLEMAQWRSMSADNFQSALDRLGSCYVEFCRQLGSFCTLLGMEVNFSLQGQRDREMLEASFQTQLVH